MRIVAGDIGGTHARFAIAELFPAQPPRLSAVRKYRTREHADLASAWATFARDSGGDLPYVAAFAVAAPIEADLLRFTNSDWTIDRRTIAGDLGLDRLLLLNDFGAVAHAVAVLDQADFAVLTGPMGGPPEVTTVIGPGTGLGVSILIRRHGGIEIVETEAAHIGFAPQSEAEAQVEQAVRARYGRCSVERVVSGPGLVEIHTALGSGDAVDAARLWAAALDDNDPEAALALDLFVGAFGAVAGDLSLAHGSMTVIVAGGLANQMPDRLASALFHDRFVAKGRYRARMERVSVLLATHPEPGLLGAAMAFQRADGP